MATIVMATYTCGDSPSPSDLCDLQSYQALRREDAKDNRL